MNWRSVLTWAGIGAFIGFSIAVGMYSPMKNENFVYLIYIGMMAGALLGMRYPADTRASAYAFPLGFTATTLLAGLWMVKAAGPSDVYAFLAVVVAAMILVSANGFLDMFLVPITYFGGFTVAMLTFKGYQSLQGSEGAVVGLFTVGIMGAILAFFAVFGRWAFAMAKNIPRR